MRASRRIFGRGRLHPLLFEAEKRMRAGDFESAAGFFEQAALSAGLRAPELYLRAGRARLLSGQSTAAMALLRHGLGLLAEARRWGELEGLGWRVVFALRRQGLVAEARQAAGWMEDWLDRPGLAEAMIEQAPAQPAAEIRLPVSCPSCGAPLDRRRLEWADSQTAVCNFCGALVRGERD